MLILIIKKLELDWLSGSIEVLSKIITLNALFMKLSRGGGGGKS